jgi:hypothetical protein
VAIISESELPVFWIYDCCTCCTCPIFLSYFEKFWSKRSAAQMDRGAFIPPGFSGCGLVDFVAC